MNVSSPSDDDVWYTLYVESPEGQTQRALSPGGSEDPTDQPSTQRALRLHDVDRDGRSALWLACHDHNISSLDLILDARGGDLNSVDVSGLTPLQIAACNNQPLTIEHLVRRGADLNAVERKHRTALFLAASYASLRAVNTLIKCGAQLDMVDDAGKSAWQVAFVKARERRDGAGFEGSKYFRVAFAIVLGGADLGALDERDGIIEMFCFAARSGNVEALQHYLDKIKGDVDTRDQQGNSLLATAIQHGQVKTVRYLLAAGANFESPDCDGRSPLVQATAGVAGQYIVSALIDAGANVNARDRTGSTALRYAVQLADYEVTKLLIKHGADVKSCTDPSTDTILRLAIDAGSLEITETLLLAGVDVNEVGVDDITPVLRAFNLDHVKIAKLLIQNGADLNQVKEQGIDRDAYGSKRSLLSLAIRSNEIELLRMLAASDALAQIPTSGFVKAVTNMEDGEHAEVLDFLYDHHFLTPMLIDSLGRALIAEEKIARTWDIVQWAIIKGLDVNIADSQGKTLLVKIVGHHDHERAKWLIERGADIHVKAHRTGKPWIWPSNQLARMRTMLKAGVPIDTRNEHGGTPLIAYATHGRIEGVKFALDHGADINARDYLSVTPLIAAARGHHPEVLKLLVSHGADMSHRDASQKSAYDYVIDANLPGALPGVLEYGELLDVLRIAADTAATDVDHSLVTAMQEIAYDDNPVLWSGDELDSDDIGSEEEDDEEDDDALSESEDWDFLQADDIANDTRT